MTSAVDKVILDMLNEQLRDKVISFAEYKQVLIELRSAANAPAAAAPASTSPSVDNQGKKYTSKVKNEGDFVFEERHYVDERPPQSKKAAKRARQRAAKKEAKSQAVKLVKEEPKPVKILGKPVKKAKHQKKEHIAVSLAKDNVIEKAFPSKKVKSEKKSFQQK